MEQNNNSNVTEFILLGLSPIKMIQYLLFVLFLLIYIVTLSGNLLLITITCVEYNLNSPMYLFISQLSFLDMCYSSVTLPKALANLVKEKKTISFIGCFTQLHFFLHFACTEDLILSSMAYDRYVAICHPLHYTRIMNTRVCAQMVTISWAVSFLYGMAHTISTRRLSFCDSRLINHFFCDLKALLRLSCTDPTSNILGLLLSGGMLGFSSVTVMIFSYTLITTTILKIPSIQGRWKAFSTCISHLTVVSLFYGTFMFAYFQSPHDYFHGNEALGSVLYTAVTPMLNPFIYALRNTAIKGALAKHWLRLGRIFNFNTKVQG